MARKKRARAYLESFQTNPSNPCGNNMTPQHLKDIVDVAERHKVPIIADEVSQDRLESRCGMLSIPPALDLRTHALVRMAFRTPSFDCKVRPGRHPVWPFQTIPSSRQVSRSTPRCDLQLTSRISCRLAIRLGSSPRSLERRWCRP